MDKPTAISLSDEQLAQLIGKHPQQKISPKEELVNQFLGLQKGINEQRFNYASNHIGFAAEVVKILLAHTNSSNISESRMGSICKEAVLFTETFRKQAIQYHGHLMETAPIPEQMTRTYEEIGQQLVQMDENEKQEYGKELGDMPNEEVDLAFTRENGINEKPSLSLVEKQ